MEQGQVNDTYDFGFSRPITIGDRVGLVAFNDNEVVDIMPQRSQKTVMSILDAVLRMNQALRVGSGVPHAPERLNEALTKAVRLVTHDALVVVVSDFFGADEHTTCLASQLAAHNDVLGQIADAVVLVTAHAQFGNRVGAAVGGRYRHNQPRLMRHFALTPHQKKVFQTGRYLTVPLGRDHHKPVAGRQLFGNRAQVPLPVRVALPDAFVPQRQRIAGQWEQPGRIAEFLRLKGPLDETRDLFALRGLSVAAADDAYFHVRRLEVFEMYAVYRVAAYSSESPP